MASVGAVDAAAGGRAVGRGGVVTGGGRVGERLGAAGAVGLADLVGVLTPGAGDLGGDAPAVQVGLDLAGGEVPVVDVLGEVDLDQLEEPALVGGEPAVGEARLQLAGGVEPLGGLPGGEVVEGAGQREQVAAGLGLADDLLGGGIALGVDAGLGLHLLLVGAA